MAKLYKGFQSDIYDANFPMVGGGEQIMCPTVAFHSVAKTWANKRDGTPVLYTIAPTNNMVASECDDNCAWNGPQYNGTAEVRGRAGRGGRGRKRPGNASKAALESWVGCAGSFSAASPQPCTRKPRPAPRRAAPVPPPPTGRALRHRVG